MSAWPGSPAHAVAQTARFVHSLHSRLAAGADPGATLAALIAEALGARCARAGEVVRGITAPTGFVEHAASHDGARLHASAEGVIARTLALNTPTATLRLADAGPHAAAPLGLSVESLADADLLVSTQRLPDGRTGAVVVERAPGAPDFTEAERDALHALHAEIGPWFWPRALAAGDHHAAPGHNGLHAADHASNGRANNGHAGNGHAPGLPALQLLARLTPAQRGVLPYLLEGLRESDIGKLIFRSRYTVHDHARAIYGALGVRNRVELVLLCTRSGITAAGLRAAEAAEGPALPTIAVEPALAVTHSNGHAGVRAS